MSRRAATTKAKLPYLTDRAFEEEAELLLAEYGTQFGAVLAPPIPIDEMVELYLELQLEFIDLQDLFGVDDVHGALWVGESRVGIDERLDPATNASMLGRYRFTLAHEAGHWRLHRHLFKHSANQLTLLPDGVVRPEYICRSRDTDPIEYQANRFASCVLMPRQMVRQAWHEWRGDDDSICLADLRANKQQILSAEVLNRGSVKLGDGATDDMMLEFVARPLAELFEVSAEAMRIRLEGLSLLLRAKKNMLF